MRERCTDCDGTGFISICVVCDTCGGLGEVDVEQTIVEERNYFPPSETGQLLMELNDLDNLNDWEIGFLNNVTERYIDRGVELSAKQLKTCKEILKERSQ